MPDLKHAVDQLDKLLQLLVETVMEEFRLELEDLAAVMDRRNGAPPADSGEHQQDS
jgi:hypothetical protein